MPRCVEVPDNLHVLNCYYVVQQWLKVLKYATPVDSVRTFSACKILKKTRTHSSSLNPNRLPHLEANILQPIIRYHLKPKLVKHKHRNSS